MRYKNNTTKMHFDVSGQMVHTFGGKKTVETLVKDIVPKFLETRARHADDIRNGQFGRQCIRDGFRLAARVEKCGKKRCWLTLEVSNLESNIRDGSVEFHMHPGYSKTVQKIQMRGGIAKYKEVTSHYGPWTLGAKVLETGTLLELDLATIPGAKKWWYQEAYDFA